MAETAKRLRTEEEPGATRCVQAGDVSTECTGNAGARAAVAPAGSAAMPAELRAKIEHALEALGEVEYHRRLHRKGPGPVQPRCVPAEDLVHEKVETLHRGTRTECTIGAVTLNARISSGMTSGTRTCSRHDYRQGSDTGPAPHWPHGWGTPQLCFPPHSLSLGRVRRDS